MPISPAGDHSQAVPQTGHQKVRQVDGRKGELLSLKLVQGPSHGERQTDHYSHEDDCPDPPSYPELAAPLWNAYFNRQDSPYMTWILLSFYTESQFLGKPKYGRQDSSLYANARKPLGYRLPV